MYDSGVLLGDISGNDDDWMGFINWDGVLGAVALVLYDLGQHEKRESRVWMFIYCLASGCLNIGATKLVVRVGQKIHDVL